MKKERTKKTILPAFKSESEEADWLASEEGQNVVEKLFELAEKAGTLKRGVPPALSRHLKKTEPTKLLSIRYPESDIQRAQAVAERKGLSYQSYIKMLLREGLDREEASSGRRAR